MKECKCEKCKDSCSYRPGWFLPEQIESLLKHFKKKTIRELLESKKIVIDWYEGAEDILLLAPNIKKNNEIYYPADPRGECVFYICGLCEIHNIKPFECAESIHSSSSEENEKRHDNISEEWEKTTILEEFRNEIYVEELGFFDIMGMF